MYKLKKLNNDMNIINIIESFETNILIKWNRFKLKYVDDMTLSSL